MRRTAFRAIALAAIAALLLLAAGCGGDDDESAADTQAAPAATADSDATTDDTEATETDAAETESDDSDEVQVGGTEECRELVELGSKVSEALGGTGAGDTEKTKEVMNEFADKAPEEIRDDFKVIAAAYATIADALEDVDVKAGEAPSPEAMQKLQEAASKLDQQAVTEANTNITAWVTKNCSAG